VRHLEKMTGHTRLYRCGATYYHRAVVPKEIINSYEKRDETFSLRTKDIAEALQRVRVEVGQDGASESPTPTDRCALSWSLGSQHIKPIPKPPHMVLRSSSVSFVAHEMP
jgi:hypothetical protein